MENLNALFQNPMYILIIYIIISFIGIILHDFKYLFFLNSNSILKSCIITGIYCIFNTSTTVFIAKQPIYISLPVITITNIISMYIAMTYQERTLRETIYKFEISTKYPDLRFRLKDWFKCHNVPYQYSIYYFENDKDNDFERTQGIEVNQFGEALYYRYVVYAFTKKHSKNLEDMLDTYNQKDVKYVKIPTSYFKEDKRNEDNKGALKQK